MEDTSLALNFLIAILAIANPLVKVPLWIEGSVQDVHQVRWRLAVLVTTVGGGILLLFLWLGGPILRLFSIDLASFRIAGGLVILLIGIDMLRGQAVNVEEDRSDEGPRSPLSQAKTRFSQVIVPLVLPMIAGPGSMTTVIIYGTQASSLAEYAVLSGILVGVLLLILATLLGSYRLHALIGTMGMRLLTRVFGLIVMAIAVQFILEGLGDVFPQWITPGSPLSG